MLHARRDTTHAANSAAIVVVCYAHGSPISLPHGLNPNPNSNPELNHN